jgi:hypothetical protein
VKWQVKEIDTYLQAKEYVDTVIIPLIPISMGQDMKSIVSMGEFITIISDELERQFRGRVIQLPPFTYLKKEDKENRESRLREWCNELKAEGAKSIVLLTSDFEWKNSEQELENQVIWLPTIPLESMESKYQRQVVDDQIKQLIPILTTMWQK